MPIKGDPNSTADQQNRRYEERDYSEDLAFTTGKPPGANKLDHSHQKSNDPNGHQGLFAIEESGGKGDQRDREEKVPNRQLRKHEAHSTYDEGQLQNRRTLALVHSDLDLFLLKRKVGKYPSSLNFAS